MRRSLRMTLPSATLVVASLAGVALLVSSTAAARTDASTGASTAAAKAHSCLVMTGAGDPAFTKNFNPYAGGGLPSNSIAQGAFYEPLIVVPAGGHKTLP